LNEALESSTVLEPAFDSAGLVTAVCTDAVSGDVLMVAHMNAAALMATQETGRATFWSRSRKQLWTKGETSGHYLNVIEMRIDCDQDALWLKCRADGPACHTNTASCFYRRVEGSRLVRDV
jgi:phosphoribosyl-AMP cyclohydrolase